MKYVHKEIFESLDDCQLMALCIEREASGEPHEGRVAVGTVILERVDHRNWDGKTIQEVILKPWQFSWTMEQAGEDYYAESVFIAEHWDTKKNIAVLKECYDIAKGMIDGNIPRDPDLAAVHCCEYVAGKFRKHMDSHPEKKGNRWWQKMRLLKTIGGHEFYVNK